MAPPLKPYLQMIRLPNVFTAAADPLAGWLLVAGSLGEPARWLPLCLASMAIYAAGIALNDLLDLEVDRVERPNRPLPSGRVPVRIAAAIGWGGLALGLGLATLAGPVLSGDWGPFGVAAALIACVIGYNAGLKHTPVGPLVMGTCRGLNLLLGAAGADRLGGPPLWAAAAAYGLFVAGVTVISRSETKAGETRGVALGMILQNLALLGLLALALRPGSFPKPDTARPIVPPEGLLVFAILGAVINLADARAIRQPLPATIQRAVKTGVLSLIWIDVGLVAGVRGLPASAAVAVLWLPAFLLAKWLYTT